MMTPKSIFILVAFCLVFALSCEDYDDQLESTWGDEAADGYTPLITDGMRDNGHPSVGLLNNGCTSTLIGKRAVVTARHCVKNGGSATFRAGGKTYRSSRVVTHNTSDIALVVLQKEVSGITPSPVNVTKPKVGQRITLVGFGQTSENGGGFGTKRKGTNSISRLTSTMFYFEGSGNGKSSNCYGDSGGPAFIVLNGREVVAGVTSGGREPCGTLAYDVRVDVFVQWLEQKARAAGADIVRSDSVGSGGGGSGDDNQNDDQNDESCHEYPLGHGSYCSESCRCDVGEGDCDRDSQCQAGLTCVQQSGTDYCREGSSASARVQLSKSTYSVNEPIRIRFSNLPGNRYDWIATYKSGTSHDRYIKWAYTNGAANGNMELPGLSAGKYEVRLFLDDSYNLENRVSFKVR